MNEGELIVSFLKGKNKTGQNVRLDRKPPFLIDIFSKSARTLSF